MLKRLIDYFRGYEKIAIVRELSGAVIRIARVKGYELSKDYEWIRIEGVGDDLLIRSSTIKEVRIARRRDLPKYTNKGKGRVRP
jgi:hypothetical protein